MNPIHFLLFLIVIASTTAFHTAPWASPSSTASLLPLHRQYKQNEQRPQSALTRLATIRGGVSGKVSEVRTLEETEEALNGAGSKLVVLDFTATWCGPCKLISPVFEGLSEEISENEAVFLKVDVDVNEETAKKFEVSQMPTFIFVKNSEVKGRLVGANPDKLREAVFRLL
ncbi:thioredoxin-1 [Nannochloropsis gaditana CCMP526]|uniref:thioredoxin-1 n=1 Tax=Nannochloropsis gaditana (strain CCMP526) TaxID=1093141 RepID=UPI00029F7868|nr:thioredoxin-1 [Nannochloropsis gaditana CCMP526]EKU21682.1 thioredoxin-1 [Nannochloropsis gaditana CCMP526]|eukprot:XP_005854675.1 thioredoxin-1 [Nannochloropsis gaditana CCMP526]